MENVNLEYVIENGDAFPTKHQTVFSPTDFNIAEDEWEEMTNDEKDALYEEHIMEEIGQKLAFTVK